MTTFLDGLGGQQFGFEILRIEPGLKNVNFVLILNTERTLFWPGWGGRHFGWKFWNSDLPPKKSMFITLFHYKMDTFLARLGAGPFGP